jgi:isoleucyl-tRNA synthetase
VKNNLKVRQPLRQLLVPVLNKHDREIILSVRDIILDEINVKELNIIEGDSDIIVKKAKPNFKSIGPKFGKDVKKVQQLILTLGKQDISDVEKAGKITKNNFEIGLNDIEIFTENIEGWIVESSGGITIALDTKLDDILINEGIIREFINRIQNYRKNNGFDVNDRIKINIKVNEKIRNIIYNNFETIKNEIGCDEISDEVKSEQEYYKTDINEHECEFLIHKV